MFINIIIRKYFALQENFQAKSFEKYSKENILNSNLTNEILEHRIFISNWRAKTGTIISKEKYKLIKISITKTKQKAKVFVTALHSFCIENTPDIHTSSETLNFIFIFIKDNNKWKISSITNKELFPSLYRSISEHESSDILSTYINELSNYWKEKNKKIDTLYNIFKESCNVYKSNYLDRSYPRKYDYKKAIDYAREYALQRNPAYDNFDDRGGDCTNFISQCIHAGSVPLTSMWKPYTNTWLRVNELYYYLTRKGLGSDITKLLSFEPGSIIQFYSSKKNYFSHSGFITFSLSNGDYLYCCHTYDKKDYPLSEVFPIFYDKIRIIKIVY